MNKRKAIRIIVIVFIVIITGFFIWKLSIKRADIDSNIFIECIEQDIDSLHNSSFKNIYEVKDFNDGVKSNIDNNYNKKYFSENDSDNNKQYESLLRKLNSAYAPKFIEQVYHIFNDIQWDRKDRNLIKNEVNRLQNIKGFNNSRDMKNQLNDIDVILSKYSEIADFIWNSNKISYTVDSFPIKEVKGIINKTNNYLHKNLDNPYVNNSGYLHNGLNNIFRKLFDKHISYLQERIELNLYEYKKYDQCSNFFKEIVNPLVDELTVINNKIYNVDDIYFNQQFNMILYKLNDIETDAIQYFESQN